MKEIKFDILNFFSIPLFKIKINPSLYKKNYYVKEIEKNYSISKDRNKWDTESNIHHIYGDESNKKFKNIDWENIKELYKNIFYKFCMETLNIEKNFNVHFSVRNYTAIKKEQFMKAHEHINGSDFSCVHYIQYPKGSSPIRFINHNDFSSYFRYLRPDLYNLLNCKDLNNSYVYGYYDFIPEEDDLIIFPSVFKHEIPLSKNNIKKSRISVVTNLTIEKIK